ncbi:ice-binding family protein [Pontibacter russatus]|uniref:ice-binding family protein n=1 Tax=Pontibacter russatus TaxID=2694929 RepID=UPI00137A8AB1|nr:ice-binding family protein [Pontibacter russatus]
MVSLVAFAQGVPQLGPLYEFNALASLKVKNEGGTVVHASVGASDGPIEGFPPGEIRREKHPQTAYAKLAIAQAREVQSLLAGYPATATLSSGNLAGKTITPGVYHINGNATLNGKLTFNGQGQDNPLIIIKVSGKLDIERAEYEMLNGASGINLYWLVEGDVTVNRGASALGNVFSGSNITLNEGAQLQGRLVATEGEIRLTNNVLNFPADLEITLGKTPGSKGVNTYDFGETITYTIAIKNKGPVNENGVAVADIQYTGELLHYASSVPDAPFDGSTWSVGNLDYKEEATLTITARINKAGSGYLRALVYGYGIDEIRSNNTADLSFCVLLSGTGEITGPRQVCVNESYIYSIAEVEGATRFIWSVPSGWTYTMLSKTSIQVKAGANSGLVKVVASNTCGEGPARVVEVTSMAAPPAKPDAISGPASLCGNQKNIIYSITAVDRATSYTWAVPEGWVILKGQGTTEITVNTAGTGGQVTVQPSNSCGVGESQQLPVTISEAAPVAAAVIRGSLQGCGGNTAIYTADPVAGATGYKWSVPAGWAITAGQGSSEITVRVGTAAGDVSVQAENSCGVGPAARLAVKPVTTAPAALGPVTGATLACTVEEGLIYAVEPVATALSYDWRVPAGWVITAGAGTHQITVNASVNSGEVSVAAINDCGATARSVLAVQATPNAPATPGPIAGAQFGCAGSTGTYSVAAVAGATSYIWTVPTGWSVTAGQGTTSIRAKVGTGSGSITVKAVSACGTSPQKSLSVTPASATPANVKLSEGSSSVCTGTTFTIQALNAANLGTLVWQVPAGWAVVSGQGTPQLTVKAGSTSGTVRLTVTNGCGELTVSKAVTVSTQPPAAPGAISGTPSACESSTQTYSTAPVSGATSYIWAVPAGWVIVKGQGTPAIEVKTGKTAGNITVTAANGCGNSSQSAVLAVVPTVGAPAAVGAIQGPQGSFCQGTANLSYSITALQNAASYIWEVPSGWAITAGQGTTSIKVTAGTTAGDIKVTAANACGTGSTKALPVAPQVLPSTPVFASGPHIPCVGVPTVYTVAGATGVDSYIWEVPAGWVILKGQGTASIEVKATHTAGEMKVTARNSCGGSNTTKLEVTPAEGLPAAPGAVEGPANVCVSQSVIYKVTSASAAASYAWSVPAGWEITAGQGTGAITVTAGSGAGTVEVAAVSGCGSGQRVSMQVSGAALAAPALIIDSSSPCTGLVYEVAAAPGTTAYIWEVPPGWTITSGGGSNKITVTPGDGAGAITLSVSNGVCSSAPISIVPDRNLAKSELSFPNVFSPNNDGNNDTWVIRNLQNYPQNELTVLNRWGNEVYKAKGYSGNWDGDNLSEGTYFYVASVKMCDGAEKVFKGFVTIVR